MVRVPGKLPFFAGVDPHGSQTRHPRAGFEDHQPAVGRHVSGSAAVAANASRLAGGQIHRVNGLELGLRTLEYPVIGSTTVRRIFAGLWSGWDRSESLLRRGSFAGQHGILATENGDPPSEIGLHGSNASSVAEGFPVASLIGASGTPRSSDAALVNASVPPGRKVYLLIGGGDERDAATAAVTGRQPPETDPPCRVGKTSPSSHGTKSCPSGWREISRPAKHEGASSTPSSSGQRDRALRPGARVCRVPQITRLIPAPTTECASSNCERSDRLPTCYRATNTLPKVDSDR
jgi:hypothetical protein